MKSKTSFISKGILYNDFKVFAWIGISYLLALLLTVPLKILMVFTEANIDSSYKLINSAYLDIFSFESPWQLILLVIVPVLTALLIFRYLHTGKSADSMHALPLKRASLYNSHLTAGIFFLFVPVIITAVISLALVSGLGIENVSAMDIFSWMGITLLLNLFLFMTTVMVGMCIGMSSLQGVLTYILLLLPTGLSFLLLDNIRLYVYGFAYGYYNITGVERLSPLLRISAISYHPFTAVEVIFYLLIILLMYFLGRYIYRRRPLEMAGNAITFASLRPIFKYGVSFCTMLLLGSYFNEVQQHSMGWIMFGYVLGSLLGYFLSEILLQKSLSVFKFRAVKGYGIFALVMILLIGGMHYDISGYETRIPQLSEVEQVYLDNSFHCLNFSSSYPEDWDFENRFHGQPKLYTKADSIKSIHALQQEIIANRKEEKNGILNREDLDTFCFTYKLKNGKMIYRQYAINPDDYPSELKAFYESREYKSLHYIILKTRAADVDMIKINANDVEKTVKITDSLLIKEAITALQKDALEQSYEEMRAARPSWARINFVLNGLNDDENNSFSIGWDKSDENFGKMLKSIGEYENARLIPSEDIEYAIVEKMPAEEFFNKHSTTMIKEHLQELEKDQNFIKITDPDELEICLSEYEYDYEYKAAYNIFFILKNGNYLSGRFYEENIPDFIK